MPIKSGLVDMKPKNHVASSPPLCQISRPQDPGTSGPGPPGRLATRDFSLIYVENNQVLGRGYESPVTRVDDSNGFDELLLVCSGINFV